MAIVSVSNGVVTANPHRRRQFDNGVTALRAGDLFKFSAGLTIPAADNDENLRLWVAESPADASGLAAKKQGVTGVPLADAIVRMAYTGGTPVIGTDYGISDQRTVDVANVTQLVVTVVGVDTDAGTCEVIEYQISA